MSLKILKLPSLGKKKKVERVRVSRVYTVHNCSCTFSLVLLFQIHFFFSCVVVPLKYQSIFFHLIFMVETRACDMTIIMMIILIILSKGLQGATPLIVKRM